MLVCSLRCSSKIYLLVYSPCQSSRGVLKDWSTFQQSTKAPSGFFFSWSFPFCFLIWLSCFSLICKVIRRLHWNNFLYDLLTEFTSWMIASILKIHKIKEGQKGVYSFALFQQLLFAVHKKVPKMTSNGGSVQYKNLNKCTYRNRRDVQMSTHSSMQRKHKVLQRNLPEDPFKGKEPWRVGEQRAEVMEKKK